MGCAVPVGGNGRPAIEVETDTELTIEIDSTDSTSVVTEIGTGGSTVPVAEDSLDVSDIGCGEAAVAVRPTVVKATDVVSVPLVEPGNSVGIDG